VFGEGVAVEVHRFDRGGANAAQLIKGGQLVVVDLKKKRKKRCVCTTVSNK
jgi:hypothetical protein